MKLVFLHTSDLHGYLWPTAYQKSDQEVPYSLSRLKTLIDEQYQTYGKDHVVLTDSGDFLQGSAMAAYANQIPYEAGLKPMCQAFNLLEYDAHVLGNHDFDFGLPYLKAFSKLTQPSALLNSNILSTNLQEPFIGTPFKIIVKSGIRIGLIGACTPFVNHWEPEANIKGLKFISITSAIKKMAAHVRPLVDVLVLIAHTGFENDPETGQSLEPNNGENEGYRLLKEIPELDVFLVGHQHKKIALVLNHKAIVMPGVRGSCIGKVVLDVKRRADGKIEIIDAESILLSSQFYQPNHKMLQQLAPLEAKTEKWLDQPLVHLKQPILINDPVQARLQGTPFINLVQQMQLFFTHADLSETSLMSETAPGFSQNVTRRQLFLNYPFANQLCCVQITGSELKDILEYTASFLILKNGKVIFDPKRVTPYNQLYNFDLFYLLTYRVQVSRPIGLRVTKLQLHHEPILPDQKYKLAVNSYRASGGGFYPHFSAERIQKKLDSDYVQLFTTYFQKQPLLDTKIRYRFEP